VPHEVVLFWVVAAAFLIADNLVLLPTGSDYLRFGMSRRFRYIPAVRLEARGRELVVLNPLNLFHRAAVTTRSLGRMNGGTLLSAHRRVGRALPTMNLLSWFGYAYFAAAVVLASLSFVIHFSSVLTAFLLVHLVCWTVMSVVLLRRRNTLGLTGYQTFVFVAEAAFVPAYTINLGKRVWSKQLLDLPAMTIGIRHFKRMRAGPERDLYVHQIRQRISVIEEGLADEEPGVDARQAAEGSSVAPAVALSGGTSEPRSALDLLREAKACLTA
jgi:hypothetical protein